MHTLGIEDIMISGSVLDVPGTRFVPDILPHHGPLSGIHACLTAAVNPAVLFLSVDTPLIPPELLQKLLDEHTGGVTLLRHGEQIEPLLGVYDRALAGLCEPVLKSGQTAVRQLLKQTDIHFVYYEGDADVFLNCNTPQEYEALSDTPGPPARHAAPSCHHGTQKHACR